MQFQIRRTENEWEIKPCSGVFEDEVVGKADGVCIRDAVFSNKVICGDLTAVWGLTLNPDVYSDVHTLRGLKIGKSFDTRPSRKTVEDYDGYLFAPGRPSRSADRVMVMGAEVYVKGAQ